MWDGYVLSGDVEVYEKILSIDHKFGIQTGQTNPEGFKYSQGVLHLHDISIIFYLSKEKTTLPLSLGNNQF